MNRIEVIKVSELLADLKSTHVDDLDLLYERLMKSITIKQLMGATYFECDFAGMTTVDITYLRDKFDNLPDKKFNIEFVNIKHLSLSLNNEVRAAHILFDYEANEISLEEVYDTLNTMVQSILTSNQTCIIDFSKLSPNINVENYSYSSTIQGIGFLIKNPKLALKLLKLKSVYGDKLEYAGLHSNSLTRMTYVSNYFTTPYFKNINEMRDFIHQEYKVSDFVVVNNLVISYETEKDLKEKMKEFSVKNVKQEKTIYDIFARSYLPYANISLGIVTNITDDALYFSKIVIRNSETEEQLSKGRFTYSISPSPEKLSFKELLDCTKSIHGVELTSESESLYRFIEGISPNPPRERKIYYSTQRAKMFLEWLQKHTTVRKVERYDMKPDIEYLKQDALKHTVFGNLEDMFS